MGVISNAYYETLQHKITELTDWLIYWSSSFVFNHQWQLITKNYTIMTKRCQLDYFFVWFFFYILQKLIINCRLDRLKYEIQNLFFLANCNWNSNSKAYHSFSHKHNIRITQRWNVVFRYGRSPEFWVCLHPTPDRISCIH